MRPPDIHIKLDEKDLAEADRALRAIPGGFDRAMPRAINDTVSMAGTDMKREVAKKLPVKSGAIGRRIKVYKASRYNLRATIRANHYRIALPEYKNTRPKHIGPPYPRGGVRFTSAKTGQRELLKHGFIAQMQSGHIGAFIRSRYTKKGQTLMQSKNKEAIYERRGPSVYQVISKEPGLVDGVSQRASANLVKKIDHSVGLELDRWRNR